MGLTVRGFKPMSALAAAQRAAQEPRGDIDHGNYLLIGHAGGTDHPEGSHDTAIRAVGCRHHAAVGEHIVTRFRADENRHVTDPRAEVEKLSLIAYVCNVGEQLAQLARVA